MQSQDVNMQSAEPNIGSNKGSLYFSMRGKYLQSKEPSKFIQYIYYLQWNPTKINDPTESLILTPYLHNITTEKYPLQQGNYLFHKTN